jgi:hypothetical protein
MKIWTFIFTGLLAASSAWALGPLPETTGWSGFVSLGVGGGSLESNMIADVKVIDVDLGASTITDYGAPEDESFAVPAVALNVSYLFKDKKTLFSIGNDLANFLQFDRSTIISIRHDTDAGGRFQLAIDSAAAIQTEVWEDPYLLGEDRKKTARDATGLRFTWDKIMGSQFELKALTRNIELDQESSGASLDLSAAERGLLSREGDWTRLELGYLFTLGGGEHLIRPHIAALDRDLDGAAMSQDGFEVGVSYVRNTPRYGWATVVNFSSLDGDVVNPIFGGVNDADGFGFATQIFFKQLFGKSAWQPNVSLAMGEVDSDLDFYDSEGWMVTVGLSRRF